MALHPTAAGVARSLDRDEADQYLVIGARLGQEGLLQREFYAEFLHSVGGGSALVAFGFVALDA